MKKASYWLVFMVFLSGCYYDVEEELYPDPGCDTNNVTYTQTVLPIIENDCYRCHDAANNFGGVTLEGYENLKRYVDNGKLLGVINHQPGFPPMPQNEPQLLDCEIEKIEQWVLEGALDN